MGAGGPEALASEGKPAPEKRSNCGNHPQTACIAWHANSSLKHALRCPHFTLLQYTNPKLKVRSS